MEGEVTTTVAVVALALFPSIRRELVVVEGDDSDSDSDSDESLYVDPMSTARAGIFLRFTFWIFRGTFTTYIPWNLWEVSYGKYGERLLTFGPLFVALRPKDWGKEPSTGPDGRPVEKDS